MTTNWEKLKKVKEFINSIAVKGQEVLLLVRFVVAVVVVVPEKKKT